LEKFIPYFLKKYERVRFPPTMATTPTTATTPMRMSPSQHGRSTLKGYSRTTCPISVLSYISVTHTGGVADRAKL